MTAVEFSRESVPSRWLALDVLRAGAVLLMIQGHTFTALLEPSAYQGSWVQAYGLLHGLTAPMFLIGGGLAYGLVSFGREAPLYWPLHRRRLRRGLLLIAIGVSLQLPAAPFRELLTRPDMRANVLRAGALQLVGLCLLTCEALWIATRRRRRFVWTLGALSLALALGAPFVWNARLSARYALGTWLDGHAGSLFPLAPWAVFFFLGVLAWFACAALAAGRGRRAGLAADGGRRWPHFASALGLIGLSLSALCYVCYLNGVQLRGWYGEHAFWHSNPLFVGFRAGLVLAWLGVLSSTETWIARTWRALPWLGRTCSLLSRRSLVAYVVHLLLLYGTPLTAGLVRHGASFSFGEASALLVYVLTVTVATSWLWDRYVATGRWQLWLGPRPASRRA